MFLLTQKKAIGSVKSSKQYHFCFICAFSVHNLISIWFCNLHSIYKLFKMPFCKKIKNVFWHKFFFGLVFFVPIAIGISIIFFEGRSSFNECDLHNWHNSLVNAFFSISICIWIEQNVFLINLCFVLTRSNHCSLFDMKITASGTKSLHQNRGRCYLHLSIFFFDMHSFLLWQNKKLFWSLFSLAN